VNNLSLAGRVMTAMLLAWIGLLGRHQSVLNGDVAAKVSRQ
jgi:hypothetical protein